MAKKGMKLEVVKGENEVREAKEQGNDLSTLKGNVTRREFVEVMQQVQERIAEITHYMQEDLNVLYADHLFPNEIWMMVLKDLINEKGVSDEELELKYNEKVRFLHEQAEKLKAEKEKAEAAEMSELNAILNGEEPVDNSVNNVDNL